MGRWFSLVMAMTAVSANATQLKPIPLWDLIESSSSVVLARVDADDERLVQLSVLETWRGETLLRVSAVNAVFDSSPGPRVGETILAFMSPREGRWTIAWIRSVDDQDPIAPMRELVKRAVSLQATVPPKSKPPVEWVALAFEDPLTRSDARDAYTPLGEGTIPPELATRVGEGFLRSPTDDVLLVAYLELSRGDQRQQLTKAFAKSIDVLVADDMPAVWAIHAIDEFEVRITPGMKVRPRRSRDDVADFFLYSRADATKTIRAMWAKVKSKWKAKR